MRFSKCLSNFVEHFGTAVPTNKQERTTLALEKEVGDRQLRLVGALSPRI